MSRLFVGLLKTVAIVVLTFTVFLFMRGILADVGGMPAVFLKAYSPSIFVETGTFTPAIILLMSTILLHLLFNFRALTPSISGPQRLAGALYGFLFGVLWFLGFLELVVVYDSDLGRHAASGLRDLVTLTAFGVLCGLFFPGRKAPQRSEANRNRGALVILFVSVSFALFHGAQYAVTLPEIEQRVDDVPSVLWLLATGAWIGVMYLLLCDRPDAPSRNAVFFAANVFGVNWLLYTSFYSLFLDIPLGHILLRCLFGVAGVLVGLLTHQWWQRRISPRTEQPHGW